MSIGIFDSGVGGLSIYSRIKEVFPDKKVVYLADKLNFPYGEKSEEDLERICNKNIDILIRNGAKIVVIACNSATVSTIQNLRKKYDLPIIGIEPAIKMAVEQTKNGKIGLIATERTVNSHDGEKWLRDGQQIFKTHNEKLIEMIENELDLISDAILKNSLSEFEKENVDSVALGCTHYHFVKDRFSQLFPQFCFFAPDLEVAKRTQQVVDEEAITLENGSDEFFATKDENLLFQFLQNSLNIKDANVRKV